MTQTNKLKKDNTILEMIEKVLTTNLKMLDMLKSTTQYEQDHFVYLVVQNLRKMCSSILHLENERMAES